MENQAERMWKDNASVAVGVGKVVRAGCKRA
jgi:hypothetical protein